MRPISFVTRSTLPLFALGVTWPIYELLKELLIYNIIDRSIQNTIDFNAWEYILTLIIGETNGVKEEVKKVC